MTRAPVRPPASGPARVRACAEPRALHHDSEVTIYSGEGRREELRAPHPAQQLTLILSSFISSLMDSEEQRRLRLVLRTRMFASDLIDLDLFLCVLIGNLNLPQHDFVPNHP